MKNFLLLCLSLICTFSFGQNKSGFEKGDSLKLVGDIEGAITAYKMADVALSTDKDVWYAYARLQALYGNSGLAFQALYKGIEGDTSVYPLTDPDFIGLIEYDAWKGVVDTIIARVEVKFGAYKNLSLAKELWMMRMKDQSYYYHLSVAEQKFEYGSAPLKAIWDLKEIYNQENQKRLGEIVEQYGWPKQSEVGGSAAQGAFLIVQHADIAYQKKYLPIMQEAAENNEANWGSLAMLIDRVNMREGKAQVYGIQVICNTPTSCFVYDVIEPHFINKRRAEVGLGSIQEYIARWNIEWTVEQE